MQNIGQKGGLYRRQLDRAVEAFSGVEEIVQAPDMHTKLISGEVTEISFRYWDGENWRDRWDSNLDDGFPLAIEVQVLIDPDRNGADAEVVSTDRLEFYRKVIHLPVAEICNDEEQQPNGQEKDASQ
jgi:hypothetical protein